MLEVNVTTGTCCIRPMQLQPDDNIVIDPGQHNVSKIYTRRRREMGDMCCPPKTKKFRNNLEGGNI